MEQKVSPLVEVEGEDMRRCFEDMILSWLSWLIETNWLVVCLILMSSTHSISLLMSGVWRSSREEFFGADGRDAFIEKHAPCLNFWRWLIWYYMDYVEYEWIWWILSSCPPRWFLDTWHLWFWLVHPEQARERERETHSPIAVPRMQQFPWQLRQLCLAVFSFAICSVSGCVLEKQMHQNIVLHKV